MALSWPVQYQSAEDDDCDNGDYNGKYGGEKRVVRGQLDIHGLNVLITPFILQGDCNNIDALWILLGGPAVGVYPCAEVFHST